MILFLEEAWEHRALILLVIVVGLLALTKRQQEAIVSLRAQLAEKPRVETHVETVVKTQVVQGPERVVEKIVEKPGGERVIERVEYRDRVVTVTGSDAISDHQEIPVCPAPQLPPAPPRWILAGSVDPFKYSSSLMLRAGVTIGGRLDLSLGHSVLGPGRSLAEVGVRF